MRAAGRRGLRFLVRLVLVAGDRSGPVICRHIREVVERDVSGGRLDKNKIAAAMIFSENRSDVDSGSTADHLAVTFSGLKAVIGW